MQDDQFHRTAPAPLFEFTHSGGGHQHRALPRHALPVQVQRRGGLPFLLRDHHGGGCINILFTQNQLPPLPPPSPVSQFLWAAEGPTSRVLIPPSSPHDRMFAPRTDGCQRPRPSTPAQAPARRRLTRSTSSRCTRPPGPMPALGPI